MNKFTIKSLIVSVLITFTLFGCDDDDDSAFSGNDNYITSFKLEKDGLSFAGAISSENISVTVPSNLSMEGATSKIVLSENAKISPDPSSITDWNSIQTFTVSSHNGKEVREYRYEIKSAGLAEEGDVVLNSQTDVNEFGAKSVEFIKGNLVIGKSVASDDDEPITLLDVLSTIKGVSGTITVNSTYAGRNLYGLHNIESANSLEILSNDFIESISLLELTTLGNNLSITSTHAKEMFFPLLKTVGGSISISSTESGILEMKELEIVGANITLSGKIKTVGMPKLGTMGQNLSLSNLSELTALELPLLKQLGHMRISSLPKLESLSLASLEKVPGDFSINYLDALESLNIPSITDVDGNFNLERLSKLATINAEKLTTVNGKLVLNTLPLVSNLNGFKSLTTVGGNLTLSYLNVTTFAGLESLATVGGTVQLSYNDVATSLDGFKSLKTIGTELFLFSMPQLKKLDGFPALQSIKKFQLGTLTSLSDVSEIFASLTSLDEIYINECRALNNIKFHNQLKTIAMNSLTLSYLNGTTLDLRGMKINEAKFQSIDGNLVVKGDEVFEGDMQTVLVGSLAIEGIKEVRNLTMTVHGYSTNVFEIPSIKKIRKDLKYEIAYQSFVQGSLPDLEEIGGQFSLNGYSSSAAVQPLLPNLKKIGSFNYSGGPLKALSFLALETVDNDFSINTFWGADEQIEQIETPKLKAIGGKLILTTASATQSNTKLTNLDFLNSLTKVAHVDIKRQKGLIDYKGLKNTLSTLSSESWTVSANAYNPTFEEMKAGQWVQP